MNKIIYLDAAASSLKPQTVIDAEMGFLASRYANAGRGVCARAVAVDNMVADVRRAVADFIHADANQIVFTSGATDGLNRVVNLARQMRKDNTRSCVVAVSDLDHHSARLPWENLCRNSGGEYVLQTLSLDDKFNIDINRIGRCDIMVITAMSNVLGTPQDVAAIIGAARVQNPNVITVVDAAQYVAHMPIDVKKWGCDFLCFSGHKIGADTGVGVMYVRDAENIAPDKFGGGMVLRVDGDGSMVPGSAPERFEAGTLPLTQIIGLGRAIEYLQSHKTDSNLIPFLYDELVQNKHIKILTSRESVMLTFVVDGMHVLDFGALVGARGVCLRVGNMCATWIHRAMGIAGSIRISVGPWNTMDDMRETAEIIKRVVK